MLAIFLGIFISMYNTRILGPRDFGILSFFLTITSFTVLFFRFGVFSSVSLLIANAKDELHEREIIGTSVIVAFFIGLSYSLFLFASSYFVDDIFNTEVGWILRYASLLLIAYPYTLLAPQISRGTNNIRTLSIFQVIPKIVYLLVALLLLRFLEIEPVHLALLNMFSFFVGVIVFIYAFHPLFTNFSKNAKQLLNLTREYGYHIFLGQIANQSTYKLDGMFITYFVNTTQLGYYALARTITTPISGLSQSLSTSLFKKYVDLDEIPKKVLFYNFFWLSACVLGLVLIANPLIVLLYSKDFLPAAALILPLALAGFFQGLYQPYSFLSAKGKGKWIRNVAYTEAVTNVLGNFILIFFYGAMGAAIASALSKFVHWMMLRRYYLIYTKENR